MQADAIPVFTLLGETGAFPDIVHCERIAERAPAHGWRIPAHRPAGMAQLIAIEDGKVAARVDDSTHHLGSGEVLFVPAHAVHAFAFAPGTLGWVVSVPLALMRIAAPGGPGLRAALSRPVSAGPDAAAGSLIDQLALCLAQSGRFRALRAIGLTQALLGAVAEAAARAPAGGTGPDARLHRLDALIAQQIGGGSEGTPAGPWRVTDYARALSVSPRHLSRICRSASGLGARDYIAQAVMEEACRLLAFTTLPVSGIGYRLGFDDPSHFSRRFRAVHRQSPGAYRQRFVSPAPPEPTAARA